jgi:hypothetical protein
MESEEATNETTTQQVVTGVAMRERDDNQTQRRNSIRDIMADDDLTPLEKRRSIQSLMDGRRRSSNATCSSNGSNRSEGEMERAAAEAAEFYSSDTDDDPMDGTSAHGYMPAHGHAHHAHHQQQQQQQNHQQPSSQEQSNMQGNTAAPTSTTTSTNGNIPHRTRRRERSVSLPGWSEEGMQAVAPLAAASTGTNSIWDDPVNVNRRMEKSRPACNHYERNCTIISPCCGLAFGCRICHDDCPVLPMPYSKRTAVMEGGQQQQQAARINWQDNVEGGVKLKHEKRRSLPLGFDEEETHHEIDRFAIRELICRLCYVRQSSKT